MKVANISHTIFSQKSLSSNTKERGGIGWPTSMGGKLTHTAVIKTSKQFM